MSEVVELCGIKLGSIFDEKAFTILNKEVIPGGDYMITVNSPSSIYNKYFKNINILHTVGGNEISMVIADNGGGYSRKECLDIINQMNDDYIEKYGDYYDMYVSENDKECSYIYYFYPPNYNVLSFKDSTSSEIKEPITQLLLMANQETDNGYVTLEAVLSYFQDAEDDKTPEEFDTTQLEKPKLKVVGLN
ncbi:hypothetical protein OAP76_07185 [Alphaproteobacteria bacterium]|nr:hypothetical protein [Alphaproteobacteria bacterium]